MFEKYMQKLKNQPPVSINKRKFIGNMCHLSTELDI